MQSSIGIQIHVHFHSQTCRESNGLNRHMDVHAQRFTCWKRFVTSHECPSVCAYGIMSAYEGVNPDREGRYTHTSINVPPCTCMNVLDHKLSRWTPMFWSEHTLVCVHSRKCANGCHMCSYINSYTTVLIHMPLYNY